MLTPFAEILRFVGIVVLPTIVVMGGIVWMILRKQDAWPREAKDRHRRKADGRGHSRMRD